MTSTSLAFPSELELGTPQENNRSRTVWFAVFLGMLLVMNGLDGLLTVLWVSNDIAVEANPLMAVLLDVHPGLFMALKSALVSLGAILLWRYRHNELATFSLVAACAAYSLVLTHHGRMILALAA